MKTERKRIVERIILAVLLLAIVVAGGIILNKKTETINDLNVQKTDLNSTLESRDSLVNELVGAFNEIEDSLTFINEKRGQIKLETREGNPNQKEAIIADIRLMNEMLEASSKKIDELNKKLKSSGINIRSFKSRIDKLTKNIEEQNQNILALQTELEKRDSKIAEMNEQVAQLENNVALKSDSLMQKSHIIEEKENELNKAYFASGTVKELEENGVLTREGGFLGIGKHKAIKDNINSSYFTQLDQRNTLSFPIFSKKAKVISEHPDSSYRFVYQDDLIAYLEIENPNEFWKISKYAVVEVK
jgi:DNA repair exonuclease SbcCD ATPase subunit